MDEKSLEESLRRIGWEQTPQVQEEIERYTNDIIEHLPPDEKYSFLISVKHPPHPPYKKHPAQFQTWREYREYINAENERFEEPYKKQVIALFESIGIQPADYEIFSLNILADLTGEQAQQLRTHTDIIKWVLADDPPAIKKELP